MIHGGHEARPSGSTRSGSSASRRRSCVATEAAGEGINLQFCHLMVNYDIPWNPASARAADGAHPPHRPDERRPHLQLRRGEHARGLRAQGDFSTKLERMEGTLGDRVFDVIGGIFAEGTTSANCSKASSWAMCRLNRPLEDRREA